MGQFGGNTYYFTNKESYERGNVNDDRSFEFKSSVRTVSGNRKGAIFEKSLWIYDRIEIHAKLEFSNSGNFPCGMGLNGAWRRILPNPESPTVDSILPTGKRPLGIKPDRKLGERNPFCTDSLGFVPLSFVLKV